MLHLFPIVALLASNLLATTISAIFVSPYGKTMSDAMK